MYNGYILINVVCGVLKNMPESNVNGKVGKGKLGFV